MRKFVCIFIIILIVICLYSRYISIYNVSVNHYLISNNKIPDSFDGFKIIHFSDLLYNSYWSEDRLDETLSLINDEKPDIVIFTGDLIDINSRYTESDQKVLNNFLNNIDVTLYKYMIEGDHDLVNTESISDTIKNTDFNILYNETIPIFYKDENPIAITAITDSEFESKDYLIPDADYVYNITMIHEPDKYDLATKADIVLAGHSLGGYVNLPVFNQLINKEGAKKYNKNITSGDKLLYISNGLGVDTPFRLNNTPSINVYTFN